LGSAPSVDVGLELLAVFFQLFFDLGQLFGVQVLGGRGAAAGEEGQPLAALHHFLGKRDKIGRDRADQRQGRVGLLDGKQLGGTIGVRHGRWCRSRLGCLSY
jgi:hypothetical protein